MGKKYRKHPIKINGTWRVPLDGGTHLIHASVSGKCSSEADALAAMVSYGVFGVDGLTPAEEHELGLSRLRQRSPEKVARYMGRERVVA